VLTGGFSAAELREAGAASIFETLPDVRESLSDLPFERPST
jgi:hypothetical protein